MLYRVRFQYGWNVKATSAEEAYAKAVTFIKAMPEAFITGVEDATLAKPKSLLSRLIFGR